MTMDSSECNGAGEARKVELEEKAGLGFGSERDPAKLDGIASAEGGENEGEGVGGPFVMVNGDSDDPSEKDLDLDGKRAKDPRQLNADPEEVIRDREVGEQGENELEAEDASLENGGDRVELVPPTENSVLEAGDLGEMIEKNGEESAKNGELVEKRAENGELGENEKAESSEQSVNGEASSENGARMGGDGELDPSVHLEDENVVERGSETELELTVAEAKEVETVDGEGGGEVLEPRSLDSNETVPVASNGIPLETDPESTVQQEQPEPELSSSVNQEEKLEESELVVPVSAVETESKQEDETEKETVVTEENGELDPALKEEGISAPVAGEEIVDQEKHKDLKVEPIEESEILVIETVQEEPLSTRTEEMEEPEDSKVEAEEESETMVSETAQEKSPSEVTAKTEEMEKSEDQEKKEGSNLEPKEESETLVSETVQEESPVEEKEEPEGESATTGEERSLECALETETEINEQPLVETETKFTCPVNEPSSLNQENDGTGSETINASVSNVNAPVEAEEERNEGDVEPVSVAHNRETEAATGQDSVQIGNIRISIGEGEAATVVDEVAQSAAALDEPVVSAVDENKAEAAQLLKQPQKIFMIKVPRFSDDELWERTKQAQLSLDEKSQFRDNLLSAKRQKQKDANDCWDELEKARAEERSARAVYNAKRQEINSVQSLINKLNKATSVDEIDDLIELKERSLQHETMTLKQEKKFIQDIKELKAQRKNLLNNMGPPAEIDEALDQQDQIYERLKKLKSELETLGKELAKAESRTKGAEERYNEEDMAWRKLQDEHRAADDVRQRAYALWRDLKNQSAKKNTYFFKYKDDQRAVSNYMTLGDTEGLRLYCNNQIETMMQLWNSNEAFRKQYVECNKISTLKRLKTVDGRALGPDEDPPVIPSYRKTVLPSRASSTRDFKADKSAPAVAVASSSSSHSDKEKKEIKSSASNKNKTSLKEKRVSDREIALVQESEKIQIKREEQEEDEKRERAAAVVVRTPEEEERIRREERENKEREEREKKERVREEQRAKAKEAEERKKRKAEKEKERAEFKARKEAELRDMKKAKKEKKKSGGTSDDAETNKAAASTDSTSAESSQTPADSQPAAATATTTAAASMRRPTRPVVVMKQLNRVQPVPQLLRNRNRRKMRTWILAICIAIAAAVAVFFIGNYFSFSDLTR